MVEMRRIGRTIPITLGNLITDKILKQLRAESISACRGVGQF